MKTTVTVQKKDIEEAVKDYVRQRITAGYSFTLEEFTMSFLDNDGQIGDFVCIVETNVNKSKGE